MERRDGMMGADMSMQRQVPMLKPCPCCGGTADYEQGRDRAFFVRCQDCGMRTGSFTWARAAGEAWNRRNTEGARIVTLFEIAELDHGQQDDTGRAAVWIEKRGGGIYAAVIRTGMDFGEIDVYEIEPDMASDWSGIDWGTESTDWRLWDRKPTKEQRRDTPWNERAAWHDARAMGTTAAAGTSFVPPAAVHLTLAGSLGPAAPQRGRLGERNDGEAVEGEAAPEAAD